MSETRIYTLRYRVDDEYITEWDGEVYDERPELHPQVAADNANLEPGQTMTVELHERVPYIETESLESESYTEPVWRCVT